MKGLTTFLLLISFVSSIHVENSVVETHVELLDSLRGHLTTCTACHVITGVIEDDAAVEHARKIIQGYCGESPSKLQKLCHDVADRLFENALDFIQTYTIKTKCEAFCGDNAKAITNETLCSGIYMILEKTEPLMDLFEMKVKSVCSTEVDADTCFGGFQKWRPFITNFLKRSILRVAREVEPSTLCNLDLDTIPNAKSALKMPRFFPQLDKNSAMSCTFCQYMIEGVCEMLTGKNSEGEGTPSSDLFLIFLDNECQALGLGQDLCEQVLGLLNFGFSLVNSMIWPEACHLVDKSCPKGSDKMCIVA